MTDFIIKKLPYNLTSNAGLALVGQYFKRLNISARMDEKLPVGRDAIANSDIFKSYLGLLVQGKNDFEAIEAFRGDEFFSRTLGVATVPSCSTLRQRMNAHAPAWFELVDAFNLTLLSARYAGRPVDFGVLSCGYMALDWDTFVMDNSDTQKEGIGRTYQGVDGFTCSAAYLGSLGYCLELALRPGVQHSARETEYNLERILPMAAQLTARPLLFRADSGLCSQTIVKEISRQAAALSREVACIIKWNPRKTPVETIAAARVADTSVTWSHLRQGKRMCLWSEVLQIEGVGTEANPARRILRLMGQNALIGTDAPLRHAAKRRRMKTVLQELMFKAARMIRHGGQWVLGLGANDSAYTVFERLYAQLGPQRRQRTASSMIHSSA